MKKTWTILLIVGAAVFSFVLLVVFIFKRGGQMYQLVNLDLGEHPLQRKFTVGPYIIELDRDYDVLWKKMSHHAVISEELEDKNGQPYLVATQKRAATLGTNVITARVKCTNESDANLVLSPIQNQAREKGIWDLCVILSYLTGRRVFLPIDGDRYLPGNFGQGAVQPDEVPRAAERAWKNKGKFTDEKLMRPFWYYLNMNETPELQVKLLLGCVSLEIIQSIHDQFTTPEISEDLKTLLSALIEEVDKSKVDVDLKNRLKGTIGNWGGSNAQEQFKAFLIDYGIVESNISGEPNERMRAIFKTRNLMSHKGEVYLPSWITDPSKARNEAFFIGGRLIPSVVEEYINRKFDLVEFSYPSHNLDDIKEYIDHGTSRGKPAYSRVT